MVLSLVSLPLVFAMLEQSQPLVQFAKLDQLLSAFAIAFEDIP